MDSDLKINEVFYSIQGEGATQGTPTIFIRLQGCNLRCKYCDTRYAQKVSPSPITIDPAGLVKTLEARFGLYRKDICITGGEPLLQDLLPTFLRLLSNYGCTTYIETNGTILPWLQLLKVGSVRYVVDYKLPTAKPKIKFQSLWFELLRNWDQLKFVVSSLDELQVVTKVVEEQRGLSIHRPIILISPAFGPKAVLDKELSNECIEFCKRKDFRFSLQIHKVLWGVRKGV